jgi:type VI secretion system secreted protein Hcp
MANDIFIKIDGIDGESVDNDHPNEIQALSWSWGLTALVASGGGSGSGGGRAVPQEFRFVHHYDKASPLLAKTAAQARHVKSVVVTERKPGAQKQDFLVITLKDVLITAVGDSDDGTGSTEQIAMNYGEIDFAYKPQDSNGNLGSAVTFDWNVKTGKIG